MSQIDPIAIFDFSNEQGLDRWYIMDDGVMGGLSKGHLSLTEAGTGLFSGDVSLDNNGGFSSVRYQIGPTELSGHRICSFRVKGDGKRYQFRIKTHYSDRHSYITYFETSGEWEVIHIPILEMYPSFRGRRLDMENFSGEQLSEISFLVGNKVEESFSLELDWMRMK